MWLPQDARFSEKRQNHRKVATQNLRSKGPSPMTAGLPGRRCAMSQSSKGNVVAIGDHLRAKSRMSRQQSAQVIADCRQLAVDQMSSSLARMLDRIEDDLFELASKTADRDAQDAMLDARAQAREKRNAIQDTFRRHFETFFDRKVNGEASAPAPAQSQTWDQMSLVNEEQLEGTLALEKMAAKLKESCDAELFALSQRMGYLL